MNVRVNYTMSLVVLTIPILFSQPIIDAKRDYITLAGYEGAHVNPNAILFDFNTRPATIQSFHRNNNDGILYQYSSIADRNGALQLYTNGCAIFNKDFSKVNGAEVINDGFVHDILCPRGYSGWQSALFLPIVEDSSSFLLVHQFVDTTTVGVVTKTLRQTLLTRKRGVYSTIYRDSLVLGDTTDGNMMTACRHGNGRDWWIIVTKLYDTKRYKLLVNGKTITKHSEQRIGISSLRGENGGGRAVFSPDGTKYVRYNFKSDLQIFDFDRCSGLLSNFKHIPIYDSADTIWGASAAISPNSRYLYVTSSRTIYQFDLSSSNIEASKIIVAEWDGRLSSVGTEHFFNMAQLGADGKIYITYTGGIDMYSIIHYPDRRDTACSVQQHIDLDAPISSGFSFPNFRLGALRGSPCDTLTTATTDITDPINVTIYPNPAKDNVCLDFTLNDYSKLSEMWIDIVDISGRVVQKQALFDYSSIVKIDVSGLVNGVYLLQIKNKERIVKVEKLVIVR
jgi:hypothetical protein